ncbi:MAG: elongation factor P [Acidobacteria bacterium]|nr:elongation factor P [Acidobacteriota bacterium]
MIAANQIRKGMIILHEDAPHRVLDFKHRTPGNLRAFVQVRLRNLRTGNSHEVRFSSQDVVQRAVLEQHEVEFLYKDGTHYHFMNTENFEQYALSEETLGEYTQYLKGGEKVQVEFFESQPIAIEMPSYVELKVVSTEPELRGATASNSPKPATLETGVVVQVPPFIREGDTIRVDPKEGRYLERAK